MKANEIEPITPKKKKKQLRDETERHDSKIQALTTTLPNTYIHMDYLRRNKTVTPNQTLQQLLD